MGETGDGARRYPIVARLAGKEFERINLDVNLLPTDERGTEEVRLRDLLGFAGIPPPTVPVIPLAQQLAEKLHGYLRSYGNGSSRPRDLYDMLVIAERLPLPPARQVVETCRETFTMRGTDWPPVVGDPPADWEEAWVDFVAAYGIPWPTLADAAGALKRFWRPILRAAVKETAVWDPDLWVWQR